MWQLIFARLHYVVFDNFYSKHSSPPNLVEFQKHSIMIQNLTPNLKH